MGFGLNLEFRSDKEYGSYNDSINIEKELVIFAKHRKLSDVNRVLSFVQTGESCYKKLRNREIHKHGVLLLFKPMRAAIGNSGTLYLTNAMQSTLFDRTTSIEFLHLSFYILVVFINLTKRAENPNKI